MSKLKKSIIGLCRQDEVDWLILRRMDVLKIKLKGVECEFNEIERRIDMPFRQDEGYLKLDKKIADEFYHILESLANELKDDIVGQANLFILIHRISCNSHDQNQLRATIVRALGELKCKELFNVLIDSLNAEYYSHLNRSAPKSIDEWLDLFREASYRTSFSNPLLSCLALSDGFSGHEVPLRYIAPMKHLLRASLFGTYAYSLDEETPSIDYFEDAYELAFIGACLIDERVSSERPTAWLDQGLMDKLISVNWLTTGSQLLRHLYGLSHRNRPTIPLHNSLRELAHDSLLRRLGKTPERNIGFLSKLSFPKDFISIFNWLYDEKVDGSLLSDTILQTILEQFVTELELVGRNIQRDLASENMLDSIMAFQLKEKKYLIMIAHLHYHLCRMNTGQLKRIEAICHKFKVLFYGGYRAVSLAKKYSELMLLIGLPIFNDTSKACHDSGMLKKYVFIISKTIVTPYFHLIERENDIWDPEYTHEVFDQSEIRFCIRRGIEFSRDKKHKGVYQSIQEAFSNIIIADWTRNLNHGSPN